ncbi:hypothetical protein M409DRAFT_68244 [Zasmidium cellare ATCC 36951]|uniref:NAD(P)-binding protein n=1 Tax=Zasmidium cellare ATCC 36951 TaxID=1080233 RepID=A0A6A6CA09_ZASCE|nr:uncharacterized protein M409DRAFT_68244 [Zasmidium cellare ATCC 36951]KAF2164027.1 hypothetical protein M409DRAFT_68244 [Zasmidium cellare ATCC 36951]
MDRYVSLHENINGPGDSRPTAEQILKDEDLIGKLTGKTILITGGTAGLGTESARVLRLTGAHVWITARNKTKGEDIAKSISSDGKPYPAVKVVEIDLSALDSVRKGAKAFLEECPKLNILMTNAGVMACPESRSAQNFELQFATNHLAHFLLFQLLKPALLSASSPTFPSRVISLSSAGHRGSSIHPDNYNLENGAYAPFVAYGQSKTANILMANEIERRYGSRGLHAWSVHPGVIFETGISRHQEGEADGLRERLTEVDEATTKVMKNTGQGAATQVWAAVGKALEGKGGLYLEDCQVSRKGIEKAEGRPSFYGHEEYIYDVQLAGRLWRDSCEMVGVEDKD